VAIEYILRRERGTTGKEMTAVARVFRVQIEPKLRSEFEPLFRTLSVEAVSSAKGCYDVEVGFPTKWAPDEYVMITKWKSEEDLVDFVGLNWNEAHIPEDMEKFALKCELHHFDIASEPISSATLESALSFIHAYNDCFYQKDIDQLRALYVPENDVVFWDNHAKCDSTSLETHLEMVGRFFSEGKLTESGDVEPLVLEDLQVTCLNGTAILTVILRYQSKPTPGVRTTFVLVDVDGEWRAKHVHHSFEP
jgi:quinol monooxygenase YgiN